MFDLDNLIPFIRKAVNDNDPSDYKYTDDELRFYLRMGAYQVEGSWECGYTFSTEAIGGNTHYFVSPEPPIWRQMLYVHKTALMMGAWETTYSYTLASIKVSYNSKKDDMKRIQDMYDEIEYEHRYTDAGFAYNTWDDYFSRLNLIWSEISEGYR